MSVPFLPALSGLDSDFDGGELNLQQLSHLNGIFVDVGAQDFPKAFDFLHNIIARYGVGLAVHLNVTTLQRADDIPDLLDAGASKVFVNKDQLKELHEGRSIDSERLVLTISHADNQPQKQISEEFRASKGGICLRGINHFSLLDACAAQSGHDRRPIYYSGNDDQQHFDLDTYTKYLDLPAIRIISAAHLTVNSPDSPLSISSLLQAKSDRADGLLSTLVTDERGIALGLVYSNAESIHESLKTGRGVYHSRKRGLWYKGESSGDVQELVSISLDCDRDCLKFVVRQRGRGFCHLGTATCFGSYNGLSQLEKTLQSRKASAPDGSYTARLFSSPDLLRAKIMEEAEELCDATTQQEIAAEAADLLYFAMTKCVSAGVSLSDVETSLDAKSLKVKRRKGDAKPKWAGRDPSASMPGPMKTDAETIKEAASVPKANGDHAGIRDGMIRMRRHDVSASSQQTLMTALQRPSQRSTDTVMEIVNPIVKAVREKGDAALLEYTQKFEKATSLTSPVLRAPFHQSLMSLPQETIDAIDLSFDNIRRFHEAQREEKPLVVETMPGVRCSRFCRPIERVGLYVPGGTAVLPSTALMLGVPAQVAGCKKIVLASPPRPDGSITPEIVYVAHKVGAESIVLAGGAQAVAAMAYGTESVTKVDKILGPGNQFVTAAKMIVSNDTSAGVSIDMPAGPSEVLVIADASARPAFVASDLLSQAEHGVDSQVILIAVGLTLAQQEAIEAELHEQAMALPRVDIVRGAIEHSVTLSVSNINEAMALSNEYAPEHLILQVEDAENVMEMVENAGSVFVGPWTPESVGDYSAGVNHSLPTYGYAKQYSGVNLASYVKHITSSSLTAEGLRNVGGAVMQLAHVEKLEAHRRAVSIRLKEMDLMEGKA
ncbi:MAG: trifunctional histidinol dehydrogenase [Caeruleum heppii]|nr:MAG: trifunctional histidinol dehydrogenase [Caeruleum heppii]